MTDVRRICTICARGSSKGVPRKNLRHIAGKPLLAYTVESAKHSNLFDCIALSSDCPEILEVGTRLGVDITVPRPDHMATDSAPKVPAIRHCFVEAEKRTNSRFAIVVDLDVTSPLRQPDDIRRAVDVLSQPHTTNVVTGARSRRSPYFNILEEHPSGYVALCKTLDKSVTRRQDSPPTFDMNASIYVWKRDALLNQDHVIGPHTRLYEMPEERSIDIDSPLDFEIVSMLLAQLHADALAL
jgi:CMP-N,N'-diacetyllegionaminic acid synthase